jgi:hypothetical protein
VRQLESNNITTHSTKANSKNTARKNQTRDREKAEEKTSRIPSKMLHHICMHLKNNSGTGQKMAKRRKHWIHRRRKGLRHCQ